MKGKVIFKVGLLCAILSLVLVVPVLGQSDVELGKQLKDYKAQTYKDLKLDAKQVKALMAVEDKCSMQRAEIVAASKKAWDDLLAALKENKPDDAKIKKLVSAYINEQAKLFNSFSSQLNEELAQMTPVQQGNYLVAMEKWREKCMPKVCIPITKPAPK